MTFSTRLLVLYMYVAVYTVNTDEKAMNAIPHPHPPFPKISGILRIKTDNYHNVYFNSFRFNVPVSSHCGELKIE